ncbi:DNA mismatch repair protein MSH5 [Porphyridium purpureum]|uniref:DNA mismatch repair protein MSH5 n=1 Tax=Porphyridium purpureum TaxID=35688 RepID=A0A5J4YIG7_PORPP|nr:DNA mismatch repair protein MSH5 [Porphyridium purpureum]|eukprot:POR0505..scf261_15
MLTEIRFAGLSPPFLTHQNNKTLMDAVRDGLKVVARSRTVENPQDDAFAEPFNLDEGDADRGDRSPILFTANASFSTASASAAARALAHQKQTMSAAAGSPDAGSECLLSILAEPSYAVSVRAVGGLMLWLARSAALAADGEASMGMSNPALGVARVLPLQLDGAVLIPPQVFSLLNIFGSESHPQLGGLGRAKESVSLCGILDCTKSALGAQVLREWMRCPLTDHAQLVRRHSTVQLLMGVEPAPFEALRDSLKMLKNIPGAVRRAREHQASTNDWLHMYACAKAAYNLRQTLRNLLGSGVQQLQQQHTQSGTGIALTAGIHSLLFDRHVDSAPETQHADHLIDSPSDSNAVLQIIRSFEAVVDVTLSGRDKRLVVRSGACETLDDLRKVYEGLDGALTEIALEEMQALVARGLNIPRMYCAYYPQIGYLVVVRKRALAPAGRDLSKEAAALGLDMDLLFASDEHEYYKTARMRQLDDELGDIFSELCDVEKAKIALMQREIVPYFEALLNSAWNLAELDCLMSLAKVCRERQWTRPDLSEIVPLRSDAPLKLEYEDGVHPITECLVPGFIPNSLSMHTGHVGVITGPNFSGKSVFMKQTLLIVYLAQIGCFVPARCARLPIFFELFVQMRGFESCADDQSSFSADCAQVAQALFRASPRSLIVFDEFGKGTIHTDALALNHALIEYVLHFAPDDRGAPLLLCSTHMSELLPHLPVSSRLHHFHMQTAEPQGDEDHTVFLYRAKRVAMTEQLESSLAISLASQFGLPRQVVRRAADIETSLRLHNNIGCRDAGKRVRSHCVSVLRMLHRFKDADMDSMSDAELLSFLDELVQMLAH